MYKIYVNIPLGQNLSSATACDENLVLYFLSKRTWGHKFFYELN
jgi:hypothetical protein